MAESSTQYMQSRGIVAGIESEINGTLPILRGERQFRYDTPLPKENTRFGDEMAEPAQSTEDVQQGKLRRISEATSAADTEDCA